MIRNVASVLDFLEKLPRVLLVTISLLLVGLVALASYETRVDLRFSFFYLLPIALSSWFIGRLAGVLLSFASAISWTAEYLGENGLGGASRATALANAPLLLSFFLIQSLLLAALRQALAREKDAARVDPLTGIANRRAFIELAEAEIRRVSRYAGHFTVAYMDMDDFKSINDRGGHETGDRALILLAQTIRGKLRASDIVARFGGDEFIVLLPETGADKAVAVLGKLRREVQEALRKAGWPATVSAGCVTFEAPPDSVDQMVRLADELMYTVKTSGKNSVASRTIRA